MIFDLKEGSVTLIVQAEKFSQFFQVYLKYLSDCYNIKLYIFSFIILQYYLYFLHLR